MTEPHQDDVEGAVERLGPEKALVEALHKFKEYSADYIAPVDLALLIAAAEAILTDNIAIVHQRCNLLKAEIERLAGTPQDRERMTARFRAFALRRGVPLTTGGEQ